MLNYHRGVLFNHNKLPHQSYNKMYGFIVSEGNKKNRTSSLGRCN